MVKLSMPRMTRRKMTLRQYNGENALHIACKNGHTDIVKLLLQKGGDSLKEAINSQTTDSLDTALHLACKIEDSDKRFETVCHLLTLGPNINVNMRDSIGDTPLHIACRRGNLEIVVLFFEDPTDSFDIRARNKNGQTPLHLACENGNIDIVRLLCNILNNVNDKDNNGNTPLHVACINGYYNVVEILSHHSSITERAQWV